MRAASWAVLAAATVCLVGAAAADAAARTLYVSPAGRDSGSCTGQQPCKTITRAVQLAAPRDTVTVDAGLYTEGVAIAKRVALVGIGFPVIDARGAPNGIRLEGPATTGSSVRGFVVEHATYEGILALHTERVTIVGNVVSNNDLGVFATPLTGECAQAGYMPGARSRAVAADLRAGGCGEGLHLLSTSHSQVVGNLVSANTGGIYLTDELGPAAHNVISNNRVLGNELDCGITLASHSRHALGSNGKPRPNAGGVYANLVTGNVANGNGVRKPGSGILLAAAYPGGGAYDNRILANKASGNGHAGVSLHSHWAGQDLNGNVIAGNVIGHNAINGGHNGRPGDVDAHVTHTTGILVWSAIRRLRGTRIYDNAISDDYWGIWTRNVPPIQPRSNAYRRVHRGIHQLRRSPNQAAARELESG